MAGGITQSVRVVRRGLIRRWASGPGITIADSAQLIGRPAIRAHPGSTIVIGERVEAISTPRKATLMLNHPCMLQTYRAGAEIVIGNDVGMSGATICGVLSIRIGDRCLLGANAMIMDTNFHPLDPVNRRYAPIPEPRERDAVVIGDDVFIGAAAVVLAGTTIGAGSVVAAGAVVRGEIPAGVIVAGNPATIVKQLA